MIEVKIVNESKNALPAYATPGSAGMDVRADVQESILLSPMERKIIPTGLRVSIPQGYECQVRPRSGLAAKHGITVLNTPGTIDSDYRGVIGVILINLSDQAYKIEPGERIAQLVFNKVEQVSFVPVDVLDETERGEGAYGHSGK